MLHINLAVFDYCNNLSVSRITLQHVTGLYLSSKGRPVVGEIQLVACSICLSSFG